MPISFTPHKELIAWPILLALVIWTALVGGSFLWAVQNEKDEIMNTAYAEAKASINKDITVRRWVTEHGGVYVPITESQKTIPWLDHVPGRDVTTTDGRHLTLLNPASVLRQIMDRYEQDYGVRGRITGLKYLNPGNAPDSWEKKQLESFIRGEKTETWEVVEIDGQPYLRHLRALVMEPGCEKCHAVLGYKLGEVRGATGLSLPLANYYQQISLHSQNFAITHGAIWLVGLFGIWVSSSMVRRRDQRLSETNATFKKLYEESSDAILLFDSTGVFVECNQAALDLLKMTREQFLLLTPSRISPEFQPDGRRSAESATEMIALAYSKGLHRFDWTCVNSAGGEFIVDVSAMPIVINEQTMLHVTWRDVTARKLAEAELQASRDRLNSVLQTALDGYWLVDLEGHLIDANDAAATMLGYTREAMLRLGPKDIDAIDTPVDVHARIERIVKSGGERFETRHRTRSGEIIDVEVSISLLPDGSALVVFVRNITERKRADEMLHRIEWMLTEHHSVMPQDDDQPYGDLTCLNTSRVILDAVGHDLLADIVGSYMHLLDTSSAIYEKNGDYAFGLFASGWCKFMDAASRNLCGTSDNREALDGGRWLCHESCCNKAARKSIETGQPADIECNGGLHLYGLPIYAGNEIIGSINFGYGNPPQNPEKLQELAGKFCVDVEGLKREAKAYQSRPPYFVEIAKKRIEAAARLIGEIVQRKRTEDALKISKDMLSETEQIGKVGGWSINIDTKLLTWTDEVYRIHDLELSHKPTIEEGINFYTKESRPIIAKAVQRAIECGEGYDLELEIITAKGNTRAVHTIGKADLNNRRVYGFFQDITEGKVIESALRESEEKYRSLVDNAQELIWKCDAQGHFSFLNKAWESTHGYRIDEMLGRGFGEFQRPEVFAHDIQEFGRHLAGGSVKNYETTHLAKDRRELTLLFNATPLCNEADEIVGAQGTAIDITERKQTELELETYRHHLEALVKERTLELQLAKEVAEAANRAKTTFLANMSHELRTPMNGVMGMIYLASLRMTDPKGLDLLNTANTSADKLLVILNDILDLTKIESERIALESVPLEICAVVEELTALLRHKAVEKDLLLTIDIPVVLMHLPLKGDPLRLGQILLNLVGNAIKFTQHGEVVLRARVVDESIGAVNIRFEVADTGIGIEREAQKRLFNLFEQGDNSTTRKYGGTGLGLAISKRLVLLMGGEIGVESEPDKGSTFWLTLPLKKGDLQSSSASPAELIDTEIELIAKYAGRRILLAEDDPINCKVAMLLLAHVGLVVDVAEDGEQALDLARNNDYALILMDVRMPKMDGLEATRQIRRLSDKKRAPILAITANAHAEDKARCLDAGMDDFLAKPVRPEQLLVTLLNWLNKSQVG